MLGERRADRSERPNSLRAILQTRNTIINVLGPPLTPIWLCGCACPPISSIPPCMETHEPIPGARRRLSCRRRSMQGGIEEIGSRCCFPYALVCALSRCSLRSLPPALRETHEYIPVAWFRHPCLQHSRKAGGEERSEQRESAPANANQRNRIRTQGSGGGAAHQGQQALRPDRY